MEKGDLTVVNIGTVFNAIQLSAFTSCLKFYLLFVAEDYTNSDFRVTLAFKHLLLLIYIFYCCCTLHIFPHAMLLAIPMEDQLQPPSRTW